MQYRYLGKSGLQISALSFGAWVTFGNQIQDNTSEKLMALAYDNGVNFFDNAETYADGNAEIVMGKILKKMKWDRTSYLLSSKVFFGDGGKLPNQRGLSRKHVTEACHAALRRLQTEYLDLYYCHRPDKNTPIEEVVWTMNILIQQGKILYWGTSEWSAQEIMEAHMAAKDYRLIGPTMEQPQYNMFVRNKIEVEYSNIFKNIGLGTTTWSPLFSGVLTGKYTGEMPENTRLSMDELQWLNKSNLKEEILQKVQQLKVLAQELGTSLPKLSIAWCAQHTDVSSVILGASKVEQLKETITSLEVIPLLTPEVNQKIEDVLRNKPKKSVF